MNFLKKCPYTSLSILLFQGWINNHGVKLMINFFINWRRFNGDDYLEGRTNDQLKQVSTVGRYHPEWLCLNDCALRVYFCKEMSPVMEVTSDGSLTGTDLNILRMASNQPNLVEKGSGFVN